MNDRDAIELARAYIVWLESEPVDGDGIGPVPPDDADLCRALLAEHERCERLEAVVAAATEFEIEDTGGDSEKASTAFSNLITAVRVFHEQCPSCGGKSNHRIKHWPWCGISPQPFSWYRDD